MKREKNLWIGVYHHRHGEDLIPMIRTTEPSELAIIRQLGDWEGEAAEEWIEVRGPWRLDFVTIGK
jgi:hypothetical protein